MTDADMVEAPASTADAAAAAADASAAAAAKALAKGKAPVTANASSADALARAAATAASAPWVEKYRPNTLDDVASHGEIIETSEWRYRWKRRGKEKKRRRLMASERNNRSIAQVGSKPLETSTSTSSGKKNHTTRPVRRLVSENRLPHLLLYGPPGTGKTSTILAVARALYGPAAMPSMVLELNASDDRGIGVVRQQVVDFASTRTIFSNKFKLVILDECDAMTKDAQFALRRVIEKYTRNARFCLIANYASKIIPALQSRCTRFRFAPLPDADVRERVLAVAEKENVGLAPGGLDAVVTLGTFFLLPCFLLPSSGAKSGAKKPVSWRRKSLDAQKKLSLSLSLLPSQKSSQ